MSIIYRINSLNISNLNFDGKKIFDTILFDSIYTCNLHCLYCHNMRTTKKVSQEELLQFINKYVEKVENFQIGCAMEPTMDKNMGKIAIAISKSVAAPSKMFRIQTNGTLLHKHDLNELKQAGINEISISFDTTDDQVHRELRGGSDLNTIKENIINLRKNWPEVDMQIMTTVNRLNLKKLGDVVKFAEKCKLNGINFRKMFHFPDSKIIKDHDKMREIFISDDEYNSEIFKITSKLRKNIKIHSMDSGKHDERFKKVKY